MIDFDRIKHSLAVANKMVEIGQEKNLSDEQLQELFILGFNHDIGYQFDGENFDHNIKGGIALKNSGYKYWQEVYYHGEINIAYSSMYLDILNMADMQINKYGEDVGYNLRLEDIKSRFGEDSSVYIKANKLINYLKNN